MMASDIIMPKAGMAMEEGRIVRWLKKEGDKVEKGEPILEIMTDKVNMEVEAEVSGTLLKILAKEGDVLPVFTTIGYIGNEGEKLPEQPTTNNKTEEVKAFKEKRKKEEVEISSSERISKKVRATPAARRLARENLLDISEIKGSGPKGRIQLADVENFIKGHKDSKKASLLAERIAEEEGINISEIEGSGVRGKVMKEDVMRFIGSDKQKELNQERKTKVIPLSNMRKVIGKRMSESFYTAPTFTLNIEVDMTEVREMRKELMDAILQETGKKITYTDIIVMATAKALKKYPLINASLVKEGILLHDYVDMGLAVGLDDGLLVPVIRNVDKMSLSEIVLATKDVIQRAVNEKLLPDELEGSTFTISNLGMYGISHFNPIINQPNSAILGVNAIIDKVVAINGEPQIRPIMTLSLTIDHRVIDGAPGAKFLKYLKELLENPILLLI